MTRFIVRLKSQEEEAAIRAMAFMAYNPAIGRVLGKGGVEAFCEMAVKRVRSLRKLTTAAKFDAFHHSWVKEIIQRIPRNSRSHDRECSYGQAQKPVNVFLKLSLTGRIVPIQRLRAACFPTCMSLLIAS